MRFSLDLLNIYGEVIWNYLEVLQGIIIGGHNLNKTKQKKNGNETVSMADL